MNYTGGCHCGKVRYEVNMEIDKAITCNCSICSKRGLVLGFTTEDNFKLLSGEDVLKDYQFGKKSIHHFFCSNCGVGSFGVGIRPDGKAMRAINLRCIDDLDFTKLPTHSYDGKSL